MDGQSSGDGGAVGNHIEVKTAWRAWVLDQTLIDNSARGGIFIVVTSLFGESCVDPLVNKSVQDLRPVVWRVILDEVVHVFDLISDHFLLVTRSAYAVSIYRDLVRQFFIFLEISVKCLFNEILNDC